MSNCGAPVGGARAALYGRSPAAGWTLEALPLILASSAIETMVREGRIVIDPFDPARLQPASYAFAIADALYEIIWRREGARTVFDWRPAQLDDGAWLLQPKTLYLAATAERIGSDEVATRVSGRPALGLPGLFVQVTADLGHQGAKHRWTLELVATKPTRLKPFQPVGQASFWRSAGAVSLYRGAFAASDEPLRSSLHAEPM